MSVRRLQRLIGSVVASLVAALAVACTTFTADERIATNEGGVPDAAPETSALPPEAGADAGADAAASADAAVPPTRNRMLFLTRAAYSGNLEGLVGADAKCNAAASVSTRPNVAGRKFGAWISTRASSAASRFFHDARPIITPNMEQLAPAGWKELTSVPHSSGILRDENGALVSDNFAVWTATASTGSLVPPPSLSCNDWTTLDGTGIVGDGRQLDETWTNGAAKPCAATARLYCLER